MEKDLAVKIHDFWFSISEKARFVLVGGFNSLVSFVFFVFLLHLFAQFFRDDTVRIYNWCKENFDIFIKELNFAYESEEDPEKLNYILKRYISAVTYQNLGI